MILAVRDMKNLSFKFINPQTQGMSSTTCGVIHKELGFKYQAPPKHIKLGRMKRDTK